MPSAKKAKRNNNRAVMYVRVKPEEHAQIAEMAAQRGYPHTIASVASELISKALQTEAATLSNKEQP